MERSSPAGYCEIEHAADWALQVWAPDLPALLEQAARGMYALSGFRQGEGPRQARHLDLCYNDAEDGLVSFLGELLYLLEADNLVFDRMDIRLGEGQLEAKLEGTESAGLDKVIKAVTYHNLEVGQTEHGFETVIVFDV